MPDRNEGLKRESSWTPSFRDIIEAIRRARARSYKPGPPPEERYRPLTEEEEAVLGGRDPLDAQLEWQLRAFLRAENTPPQRRKTGREGREGKGAGRSRAPLGSGERFRALVAKLRARGGVDDPAALAAAIGRKKYGKKRFQALSVAGRKRRRRGR